MATLSVPLKTFMLDICSSIKKFNEDTTTIKELIFSSPLLLKNTHSSVTNVWRQPVTRDLSYSAGSTQMVSLPSTTTVFSASYWRSFHKRSALLSELNFLTRSETNYRNRCSSLRETASEDYFHFHASLA